MIIKSTVPVVTILDRNKKFVTSSETRESIREKMLKLRAECMPVVDEIGNLVDVYFWNDMFKYSELEHREKDRFAC